MCYDAYTTITEVFQMALRHASDIESFITAVETLETGDTVEVDGFDSAASSTAELLDGICCIADCGADFVSLREGVDTRSDTEKVFFTVCRALYALDEGKDRPRRRDGIEKAKAKGRYKGRKPIAVDESLFDSVVTLWQGGQITAREAMSRLNLKPNTFYRRIKEREEQKMKDYKMWLSEKFEMKSGRRPSRAAGISRICGSRFMRRQKKLKKPPMRSWSFVMWSVKCATTASVQKPSIRRLYAR